jgi:hypothetical protein
MYFFSLLWVVVQLQCWFLAGGYWKAQSNSCGWRIRSFDGAVFLDFAGDYSEFGSAEHQGRYLNAYPASRPSIDELRAKWIGRAYHLSGPGVSRWIVPYWPLAAIGFCLSIPVAAANSPALFNRKQGFTQSPADARRFTLFAVNAVLVIALLWIFTPSGLLMLLGCWCIGMYAYQRATPAAQLYPSCVKCKYDLTGNVSGVCPECGTPIQPRRQSVI